MKMFHYCYLILVHALQPHSEVSWLLSNDQQQCQLCHSALGQHEESLRQLPCCSEEGCCRMELPVQTSSAQTTRNLPHPKEERGELQLHLLIRADNSRKAPPNAPLWAAPNNKKCLNPPYDLFFTLFFFCQDQRKCPILRTK